jgi:hypothetical protein
MIMMRALGACDREVRVSVPSVEHPSLWPVKNNTGDYSPMLQETAANPHTPKGCPRGPVGRGHGVCVARDARVSILLFFTDRREDHSLPHRAQPATTFLFFSLRGLSLRSSKKSGKLLRPAGASVCVGVVNALRRATHLRASHAPPPTVSLCSGPLVGGCWQLGSGKGCKSVALACWRGEHPFPFSFFLRPKQ